MKSQSDRTAGQSLTMAYRDLRLYASKSMKFVYASTIICNTFIDVVQATERDAFLEMLTVFQDLYPDIFKLRLSFKNCYFTSKPEYFKKILSSPYAIEKSIFYKYLEDFLGPNLFTATESKWKRQRKILNHSFSKKNIDSYREVFLEEAENLAENLANRDVRKNVELEDIVVDCFSQDICRSLLGAKYELDVENQRRGIDRQLWRAAFWSFRWFYQPTEFNSSLGKEFRKVKSYGDIIGKDIIYEKRKQLAESKAAPEDLESEGATRNTMLEIMLEHPVFTDERALSELQFFIIAGYETSMTSLLFIFIALALYPNIQERLYDDVVNIYGSNGPMTLEKLSQMEYAERIIKESLRIFPTGPMLGRYITDNVDLGDMVLPKNSTVFLNMLHAHRNPKYWSEPMKFDPDRFLQENVEKIYPYSYIPFGYGPRNCIGSRYAALNLKIVLITVIRKVKIFTDHRRIQDIKLKSHITLRPRDGWKLRFEARG